MLTGAGFTDHQLTDAEIRNLLTQALAQVRWAGKRVLVIIPDHTRSGPVAVFFRLLHELLWGQVAALDFLIALGTHPPMTATRINQHLGTTAQEMAGRYAGVRVFNHSWQDPASFRTVGLIPASEIEQLSNGLLHQGLPVAVNRAIFDYDQLIVCGPVFPHEVVGFSGGNKYFFPGISGPDVINVTHWLGALLTSWAIIGRQATPVRTLIDRAAALIDVPRLGLSYVVQGDGLAGLYIGAVEEAWARGADLSAQLYVIRVDRPYGQILSVMPRRYDDLWTAAKGMYKVEPILADGGEVIIYAPHITELSYTHGRWIAEIGYHVRDYFLARWDRFSAYPWAVLAHSTHLRGMGSYEGGVERPRVRVTLATGIDREQCQRVNLGYRDPATIDPAMWAGREHEGILLVPHAGEMLYRLTGEPPSTTTE